MAQETVLSLLKVSTAFFKEKGIDEAKRSAEYLLAHALGQKRLQLYLRFDQPVAENELVRFRELVRRRLRGEPVQYIVGTTEFYGLEFAVSPAVLIPRPETEHLVEAVVDRQRADADRQCADVDQQRADADRQRADVDRQRADADRQRADADRQRADADPQCADADRQRADADRQRAAGAAGEASILDIGTGSGIIAITLAAQLPNARVTAIDVSDAALEIARANAARNDVDDRISLVKQDILTSELNGIGGPFDIVVSNPPYIAAAEIETLQPEVRAFEPVEALTDGADGLTFYRRFASLLPRLLRPGGLLAVEIGYGQSGDVREIFADSGLEDIEVLKDYSGIDRVVLGRMTI